MPPSPSSAEVSLPSSALSTSGAADTITVGMSDAVSEHLLGRDPVPVDSGGGFDARFGDASRTSIAAGEPDGARGAKLSIDPSSEE